MLPSPLLIARVSRGVIFPKYSMLSEDDVKLASEIINTFKSSVGGRRGELEDALQRIENKYFRVGFDYRFIRGLAHILIRRTVFKKPKTKVDPVKARFELFLRAANSYGGFVLNEEERNSVLREVAGKLGMTVDELIECFNAVYEDEEIVADFQDIDPVSLLRQYNLSIAQTLLFKALNVVADVKVSGTNAKILLFNAKRLGLMYFAEKLPDGVRLTIDGPASILKQTERYGTRLAKLLPYLIAAERWRIRAKVKSRSGRVCTFYMDDFKRRLFPQIEMTYEPYDSEVEELFYRRFKRLGIDWSIVREPEPLVAGNMIFIPDFAFERNGEKIYLEIVGFWTKEYIEKKLRKLKLLRDVKLIIAANEELYCSKVFKDVPHEVIFFRNRLSAAEVYIRLKKLMGKTVKKASFKGEIRIPEELKEYLSSVKEEPLSKVMEIMEKYGIASEDAMDILKKMGFEIVWRTLDADDVIVRRKS